MRLHVPRHQGRAKARGRAEITLILLVSFIITAGQASGGSVSAAYQQVGASPLPRRGGMARVQNEGDKDCPLGTGCLRGRSSDEGKSKTYVDLPNTMHGDQHPSMDSVALEGAELAAYTARMRADGVNPRALPSCDMRVGVGLEFQQVQAAVDRVGQNKRDNRVVICIGPGVYRETVTVQRGQDGITLVGQGPETIIMSNRSLSQTGNTWMAATLIIYGEDFHATHLIVQNSLKTTKDPAPAVAVLSTATRWHGVGITAWQDTVSIYSGSGHFFLQCFISGIVDVTWGFGRAAFVNSTIYIRKLQDPSAKSIGLVAAFGTDKASGETTAGGLFVNCTIDGEGRALLARPYRRQSTAVFVDCYMGKVLQKEGYVDRREYLGSNEYTYLEFKSRGPGASDHRKFGQVMSREPPHEYTLKGFLPSLHQDL